MADAIERVGAILGSAVRAEHDGIGETGPNRVAAACEKAIAELEAEKVLAPQGRRRAINRRLAHFRDLLAWCRTRVGYMKPERTTFEVLT